MTKLYKLTDPQFQSGMFTSRLVRGENVTHHIAATERKPVLCSNGIIHAYESPYIAEIMSPMHIDGYKHAIMWDAEGDVVVRESGLKCGVYTLTTIRQRPRVCISELLWDKIRDALFAFTKEQSIPVPYWPYSMEHPSYLAVLLDRCYYATFGDEACALVERICEEHFNTETGK